MLQEQAFFDVLSDEIRRRILVLILKEAELCVCELFCALDMPQPKVSRHLGVMREAAVLAVRRESTRVFYRLHPQLPQWAHHALEALAQGTVFLPLYQQDARRLAGMANRPVKCTVPESGQQVPANAD